MTNALTSCEIKHRQVKQSNNQSKVVAGREGMSTRELLSSKVSLFAFVSFFCTTAVAERSCSHQLLCCGREKPQECPTGAVFISSPVPVPRRCVVYWKSCTGPEAAIILPERAVIISRDNRRNQRRLHQFVEDDKASRIGRSQNCLGGEYSEGAKSRTAGGKILYDPGVLIRKYLSRR